MTIRLTTIVLFVLGIFCADVGAQSRGSAEREELRAKNQARERLRTFRLSVDFEKQALPDVIAYIATSAGVNIIVDPRAAGGAPEDVNVTMSLNNVSARNVLEVIMDLHGLKMFWQHGVYLVTGEDVRAETMVLRVYDVRDVTMKIRDFPGETITLSQPGNQTGPGIGFTEEPEENTAPTAGDIIELIKTTTGEDAWGDRTGISAQAGLLVVTNTDAVHLKVARVIGLLRQNR